MNFDVKFQVTNQSFEIGFKESKQELVTDFGKVFNVSDDSYKRGYEEGLAKRTYETWTITLLDGTIVEKEVALL